MRLFTALWPAPAAVAALRGVTPRVAPPGWRCTDPSSWHITLAFHGEADPGVQARLLEHGVHGRPAPRLRLAGAGAFPRVRWAGVDSDGPLQELVEAAGGDPERFVAHVTVLLQRSRPGRGAERLPATPWSTHVGPWWSPAEVLLMASEPAKGGSRYRAVHRVPLG